MKKIWFDEAWEDYVYWQGEDKKTLKKINKEEHLEIAQCGSHYRDK
jgi:hypothetical protein